MFPFLKKHHHGFTLGFTLAELLIALAILGVIATFTIPKVLQSQQNSQFKAEAKEEAGMVSGAFTAYQQHNTVTASVGIQDLTAYMNYVRLNTSGAVDADPGHPGPYACGGSPLTCYQLHNGGTLMFDSTVTFATTDATSSVWFGLDPDGKYTGNSDSVFFLLTTRGRVLTAPAADSSIYFSNTPIPAMGFLDPAWFSWN